jgi:uncharacterized protein
MTKDGATPAGPALVEIDLATGSPGERAELRLYEELNDHLPTGLRRRTLLCPAGSTVGETLAALGVAAGEVDVVLADGVSVGFDHRVGAGERIAVYPVFERFDVGPLSVLPGRPLRRLRFALTPDLAALAHRLDGYDVLCMTSAEPGLVRETCAGQRRILVTRDRKVAAQARLDHAIVLRASDADAQRRELLEALQLSDRAAPG